MGLPFHDCLILVHNVKYSKREQWNSIDAIIPQVYVYYYIMEYFCIWMSCSENHHLRKPGDNEVRGGRYWWYLTVKKSFHYNFKTQYRLFLFYFEFTTKLQFNFSLILSSPWVTKSWQWLLMCCFSFVKDCISIVFTILNENLWNKGNQSNFFSKDSNNLTPTRSKSIFFVQIWHFLIIFMA